MLVEWIVSEALCSEWPVEGLHVPLSIYLPSVYYPLGQVRVRDVESSKTNSVAFARSYFLQACHLIKRIIADQKSIEERPKCLTNIRNLFLSSKGIFVGHEVKLSRFSDLYKSDVSFGEFLQEE